MRTKINNNEDKEFAIGSKIKYNDKLYEVVKCKYCENCSISSFCSASDNYVPSLLIDRDKLLSIFGKCSAIDRTDGTSVIFKEIVDDNSNEEFYKVIPLYIDDESIQLRPVEFDLPKGCEIDKEHSDLDKGIIRFKNKWMSIEDIYKLMNKDKMYCHRNSIAKYDTDSVLMAIANLIDIASYFNKDWHYDPTKEDVGYMIAYDNSIKELHYITNKVNGATDVYYGNPIFREEAVAKYVIDNPKFRYMLDKIFKV
nr:MAG TPA: hypothetical protein [Crassvirales sp.]